MTSADIQLYLSIASSVIGIVGGPLGLYFSYKASKNSKHAVNGANELAKRLSPEALYNTDEAGAVVSVRQLKPPVLKGK